MNLNLFWCIIGIIGGAVFSFIISYLFYFKGQNRKHLTYDIKTFCIISNKINQIRGLEVKYNSIEIENLYSSTITIKNIGNSIVKEHDVPNLNPISISTSGQFLDYKISCIESRTINKIVDYSLSFKEANGICNYIKFNFDYIPKNSIISFSLYHTDNITFDGDLMDGKIIPSEEYKKNLKRKMILQTVLFYVVCILLSIIFTFLFHGGVKI